MTDADRNFIRNTMLTLTGLALFACAVLAIATYVALFPVPPRPPAVVVEPTATMTATSTPLPTVAAESNPTPEATGFIQYLLSFLPGNSTSMAGPTATPPLAEVAAPTNTSAPEPTITLALIETPTPESTAILAPTPVPEPISISGVGDSIQNIDKWSGPAIVHVVGNASQRHFAVIPYDSNGNRSGSLVNTTDYYDGRNLIDFEQNQHTSRLEITSEGEWTIEILPLASARVLQVPGVINGNGDDVLILMGGIPDIANIFGNPAARHFAVLLYGSGRGLGSVVNTTDPYEGQVLIDRETEVLQIIAEGAWSISIIATP